MEGFYAVQAERDHGAIVIGTYDMTMEAAQCELCCRDLAEFIKDEDLVRVGCDRLSGEHTTECVCLTHHQSTTRSGLGAYKAVV
jgi:hypothetical protein